MNDCMTAWAAGVFEGEGCISIRETPSSPSGRRVELVVKMTDEDVLVRFHAAVGVGTLRKVNKTASRKEHWKDFWSWSVAKQQDVLLVLDRFDPYLGKRRSLKSSEARLIINENLEKRLTPLPCLWCGDMFVRKLRGSKKLYCSIEHQLLSQSSRRKMNVAG